MTTGGEPRQNQLLDSGGGWEENRAERVIVMNRTLHLLFSLCLCAGLAVAQSNPNNRDIANNVRGETVNKRPNMNDAPPLNRLPALDQTRIPEIPLPSMLLDKTVGPPAARKAPAVISIGEDQVPTRTQLEMLRHARESEISLGDVAREARRQREARRAVAPARKPRALEEQ